jgi:hypothetical protein
MSQLWKCDKHGCKGESDMPMSEKWVNNKKVNLCDKHNGEFTAISIQADKVRESMYESWLTGGTK